MVRAGQKLAEERLRRGLTLEDVAKATKIRIAFLSAIEKGEYEKLPSSAYAQGFIKNYTEYLGLSTRTISALFRREFDEEKLYRVLPEGLASSDDFAIQRTRISQGVIVFFSIFVILILYVIFQYRYAIINPPLEVIQPTEKQVVSTQEVVVTGKTDPTVSVYVNNVSVSLNQNGEFTKTIDAFTGKSIIVIKAVNTFGRETIIKRAIEVKDK